jgi:hypothetical protein
LKRDKNAAICRVFALQQGRLLCIGAAGFGKRGGHNWRCVPQELRGRNYA